MRGDNRFAATLQRKTDGRDEVGKRFAHARAGLCQQGTFALQRFRHSHGHLLLLRAVLEASSLRKQPGF